MSGTTYRGPINPNPKDGEAGIIIYGYVPSIGLAVTGVITFALILLVNAYYLVKKRGKTYRSFHILLLVGSLMEMGGYAARIASHKRPFLVSTFVAQYFLIVVAPVLFTAAIYLSLSMAVKGFACGEQLLVLRPKLVLAFFITADVVTTIIQVAGAALIGVSESAQVRGNSSPVTPKQANDILLAGLCIQTFSFVCFLTILAIALYRATRPSFPGPDIPNLGHKHLRRFLLVILATSDLILLRTTFRLAETAQGFFGTASTSETLFGCLEYLPVILALITWAVFPPSSFFKHLPGGVPPADAPAVAGSEEVREVKESRRERKERERREKEARRSEVEAQA